ncbi:MAG: transcriptional repressor [Caldisericia bacterium]|nr:transcriptional repressor [Caldisericia bacterium]
MKKSQTDQITKELTLIGLKNTPHRRKILQILDVNQPLTAEQIFLALKAEGVLINLSTVYRTLEMLSKSGFVQKMHIFHEEKCRFTLQSKEHKHHFICLRCHTMIELQECPMEAIEKTLEDEDGLQVTGHQLEIYGYCSHCH